MHYEKTDNFFLVDDALAIGGSIAGIAGSIFGGGSKEDTSLTGFQNYVATAPKIYYPSKSELLRVAKAAGWHPDYVNAIDATYDETTGTGNQGDWHFIVTSTTPQTNVKFFKGAGEQFTKTAGTSQVIIPSSTPASQYGPDNISGGGISISLNTVLIGAAVLVVVIILIKKVF